MKYHVTFDIDLQRNPYKGKFFAIEGIDGSGKTTQVHALVKQLEEKGHRVVLTKEPWDEGFIGSFIKKEILSGKTKLSPFALQYLFVADRADHLEKIIIPALKNGKIVITDRYFWSALPYGLLDRGETDYKNKDVLLAAYSILSFYHQFIVPDKTFYLDITVSNAIKRMAHKVHEIYEKEEKLTKIHRGYQWLLQAFKNEFVVINGEQAPEKVTEDIFTFVSHLIKLKINL